MANVPSLPRTRLGAGQFAQGGSAELQRVTCPGRETVVRLTVIVVIISALIAAYIFGFDNLFTWGVTQQIVGAPGSSPTPAPSRGGRWRGTGERTKTGPRRRRLTGR